MYEEELWKVPCCGKVFNFTTSIWKTLRVYHTFHSTTTIINIKLVHPINAYLEHKNIKDKKIEKQKKK